MSKKIGEALARKHVEEPQEEEKKTAELSILFWLFTLVVNENMYSHEEVKSLNSSTHLYRNV